MATPNQTPINVEHEQIPPKSCERIDVHKKDGRGEEREVLLKELHAKAQEIAKEQRVSEEAGNTLLLEAKLKDASEAFEKAFTQLREIAGSGKHLYGVQRQF
ncbi:MAG TPA: hypothetical protein VKB26_15240, partial [Candidatus Acidoferrales bacterium]|nr:hypothetical protein [Candidatus Acidoferrales bacterium]